MQNYDQKHNIQKPDNDDDNQFVGSFESFLNMIIKTSNSGKNWYNTNPHWWSYQFTCQPCYLNYNFISKTETADNDSKIAFNYIYKNPLISQISGPYKNKSNASEVKKLFDSLDPDLVRRIYKIYENDFLMFGYNLEEDF